MIAALVIGLLQKTTYSLAAQSNSADSTEQTEQTIEETTNNISNNVPDEAVQEPDKNMILSPEEALEQAIKKHPAGEINGHKKIAENETYELYLYEETLSVIIREKSSGAIVESTVQDDDGMSNESWQNFMKSGIVLEVIDNVSTQLTRVGLLNYASVTVTTQDNGFAANLHYEKYGFDIEIRGTLTENGFIVEIPDDNIIESSEQYKIGNIYVYPFMGYTYLGERDGYMFIPDGNGAIINLEDNDGKYSSGFSQKIYGGNIGFEESYVLSLFWNKYQTVNDSELLLAPVFGMVHKDSEMAFLGIIEEGAFDASIEAYPNGAYTNYNWITSKFRLRQTYVQPTSKSGGSTTLVETDRTHSDIKVRFAFINGEDASYVGLAKLYRNYLIEDLNFSKKEDTFKIRLDFLGMDKEDWFIFKKSVTATTTDQIREIYNDLRQEGVTNIVSLYKGWQKGGINALPITSYKADGKIGGTSDLTKLIKEAKEQGIELYLYQDAMRANPDTSNTTFNVVKKMDKRLYEEKTYKDVYETFVYLTPTRTKELLESLRNDYTKNGVEQLALAGISNTLFSYTYSGNSYKRVETAEVYEQIIQQLSESFHLLLETPCAYLWNYADAIYDIPVTSSNYIFTDENVPFLSIALKGLIPMYGNYTNFEANKQEYFLQLIETGISPSFYLTYEDPSKLLYTNSCDLYSSKYSIYRSEIIDYYNQLKEINEQIQGSFIKNHEKLENNVTLVTYENGVKIYLNYNKEYVTVDGMELEAMSYKVVS